MRLSVAGGALGRFGVLFLLCALCLILFQGRPTAADPTGTTVYILDLSSVATSGTDSSYDLLSTAPFAEGIQAYLTYISNVILYTTIEVIDGTTYSATSVGTAISGALAVYPSILACIGPFGDTNYNTAIAALASSNIVVIGPLTGGSAIRTWTTAGLFTTMTPEGEMLMLLKYAVVEARVKKIGFMYTTGVSCGDSLYASATSYLYTIDANDRLVSFVAAHTDSYSSSDFDTFADNYPGATLIQGKPGSVMKSFIDALMTDSRTSTADILGSSYQQVMLANAYQSNAGSVSGVLYIASSTAPVTVTSTAMTTFLGQVPAASTNHATGNLAFFGFTAMAALAITLRPSLSLSSAATYKTALWSTYSRFFFEDYIMGFYGGTYCSQGAICQCNEGGQSVWLSIFDKGLTSTLSSPVHTNLEPTCGISGTLPFATSVTLLNYPSNSILTAVYSAMNVISDPDIPDLGEGSTIAHRGVVATGITATNYDTYKVTYITDAVIGPLDTSVTTLESDVLIWSPVYDAPIINMNTDNEYYVTPTFAQDVITLYAYLATSPTTPSTNYMITAMVLSATAPQTYYMQEGIVTLAALFSLGQVYIEVLKDDEGVGDRMWNVGYNIMIGLTSSDVSSLQTFMLTNLDAVAYIPYRTFSLIYTTMSSINLGIQSRILTDSNIPYWSDSYTPLKAEALVASDALSSNPYSFRGSIFSPTFTLPLVPNGEIVGNSVTLGPYYAVNHQNQLTSKMYPRGRNWGASTVYLVPITTSIGTTSTVLFSFRPDADLYVSLAYSTTSSTSTTTTTTTTTTTAKPTTPKPTKPPTPKKPLNKKRLVSFILGALLAYFLVGLCIMIWAFCFSFCCCTGGHAPTSKTKPITVMFADIDFSASFWSELPDQHETAIAEYVDMVRKLIEKNSCYEVSFDGSRFIIVSADSYAIIHLAVEIQEVLLQHEWKTSRFDRWYEMIGKVDVALSTQVYGSVWNGYRVRMGIHTGLCGIHYQNSRRRYRYYGDTVHIALHTEELAVGGQCLVTEPTWETLTPEEVAHIDHTFLGPHSIRGQDTPMNLYLLNAIPGREFGPLRTLPEYVPDSLEGLSSSAILYRNALRRCYAEFLPDQRVEELLPLARNWDVVIPPQEGMNDEEYANHLIDLIAAKMAASPETRKPRPPVEDATILVNRDESTEDESEDPTTQDTDSFDNDTILVFQPQDIKEA